MRMRGVYEGKVRVCPKSQALICYKCSKWQQLQGVCIAFARGPVATVPEATGHLCGARMSSAHRADDSTTIAMRRRGPLKRPLRGLPSLLIIAHVTQIHSRVTMKV